MGLFGFRDGEHLLGVEPEVASGLVAEVRRSFPVALHAHRPVHADRPVVGSQDDGMPPLGHEPQDFEQVRMFEPRTGERTERRLVLGQIADNLRLGTGMRQDVEKIENDHRQIGMIHLVDIVDEPLARIGTDDLVEIELVVLALRLHLATQEILFVAVLPARLVVVEPQVGHDLVDGQRREPGEDGVAGILRGRGQDAAIEILFLDLEKAVQSRADHPPLVEAEIVDEKKRRLVRCVRHGKHLLAEQILRQHRRLVAAVREPVQIMVADELGELVVGLVLLVGENFADARIGRFGQLHLPSHELPVDLHPVVERPRIGERRGDAAELAAVIGRRLFGDELQAVHVFLDGEQHLIGIDGLDEVVGDLRTHGLVHDILLLALGHHDDGRHGAQFLDARQRFETGEPRHHLVEDDQVELPRGHQIEGVVAVVAGFDVVAFPLEEQDVGFEKFDLVVHPQNFRSAHSFPLFSDSKDNHFVRAASPSPTPVQV